MKTYFVWSLHIVIWMGYSLVELLSKRDQLTSKIILFLVFAYLAYGIAEMNVKSKRLALMMTGTTSAICLTCYQLILSYTDFFSFFNAPSSLNAFINEKTVSTSTIENGSAAIIAAVWSASKPPVQSRMIAVND